jgi:hypothetical protein
MVTSLHTSKFVRYLARAWQQEVERMANQDMQVCVCGVLGPLACRASDRAQ